jgi:glycogen operon protein
VGGDDFLLCVNMDHVPVDFALPAPRGMKRWVRIIDTAAWAERQGNCWPAPIANTMGSSYTMHPYALGVFQERNPALRAATGA